MFYNCSSLNQLPDISKFNTKNVIDMSYMFYNCSSIKELPDISKWNMEKIRDISLINKAKNTPTDYNDFYTNILSAFCSKEGD